MTGGARSLRRVLGLVVVVGLGMPLAGCLGETPGSGKPVKGFGFLTPAKPEDAPTQAKATSASSTHNALRRAALASGRVVVAGPKGYCVDGSTLKSRSTGGFALLASCEILTNGKTGHSVDPAVMTVQVQPRGLRREAPDAETMASVLAPAQVLKHENGDGLALVHVASGGDRGLATGDPKYWRGTMMVNGHLVGLAIYAPKGSSMAGRQGRKLILALAESLREASPVKGFSPAPVSGEKAQKAVKATETEAKAAGAGGGLKKLFPKLLQ